MVGTEASGVRSESVDWARDTPGRRVRAWRGGEEEMMPVDEVGTAGVGYLCCLFLHLGGDP